MEEKEKYEIPYMLEFESLSKDGKFYTLDGKQEVYHNRYRRAVTQTSVDKICKEEILDLIKQLNTK